MVAQRDFLHELLTLRKTNSLHREDCKLVNYPVKRYKFYNQKKPDQSENLIVAEARVLKQPEATRSPIDSYSLQLLLKAFYDNFIYRPMKNLGNFYIVTKSIFFDPSSKIDERYLIS